MKCMGFGLKWINFIRACLSSSSISILIDGPSTMEFSPGRAIHQGDPISRFLFIIAAEGLNILTKRAIVNDQFHFICIGHDKIVVSHLQYADDTIFFGEWSKSNAKNRKWLTILIARPAQLPSLSLDYPSVSLPQKHPLGNQSLKNSINDSRIGKQNPFQTADD
ncbi:uncharacterized protein [Rutidosis leptorrhynchoides]|uniref:uncharacterized protein n=1 Tax=Rutidosis leptorrhynchoides TaxID=125765 RepID=UPI003A99F8E4